MLSLYSPFISLPSITYSPCLFFSFPVPFFLLFVLFVTNFSLASLPIFPFSLSFSLFLLVRLSSGSSSCVSSVYSHNFPPFLALSLNVRVSPCVSVFRFVLLLRFLISARSEDSNFFPLSFPQGIYLTSFSLFLSLLPLYFPPSSASPLPLSFLFLLSRFLRGRMSERRTTWRKREKTLINTWKKI